MAGVKLACGNMRVINESSLPNTVGLNKIKLMSFTIEQVNAMLPAQFSSAFGAVYEHSPWVAEGAFLLRPALGFSSRTHVHAALVACVNAADDARKLALLNQHPELAGKEADAGALTAASSSEQASAGLTAMTTADVVQLKALNAAYRTAFGFPFIIAVRNNTQSAIFGAIKSRLANTPAMEMNNALMQVGEIARLRLLDLISEP
jgi:2-oxo-4-hydroxy-4-carboxy-5-ureidoimidazoline decarboxylase